MEGLSLLLGRSPLIISRWSRGRSPPGGPEGHFQSRQGAGPWKPWKGRGWPTCVRGVVTVRTISKEEKPPMGCILYPEYGVVGNSWKITILHLPKPLVFLVKYHRFSRVPFFFREFDGILLRYMLFYQEIPFLVLKVHFWAPNATFWVPCSKPFINVRFWRGFWGSPTGKVHISTKKCNIPPKIRIFTKKQFLAQKVRFTQECGKPPKRYFSALKHVLLQNVTSIKGFGPLRH